MVIIVGRNLVEGLSNRSGGRGLECKQKHLKHLQSKIYNQRLKWKDWIYYPQKHPCSGFLSQLKSDSKSTQIDSSCLNESQMSDTVVAQNSSQKLCLLVDSVPFVTSGLTTTVGFCKLSAMLLTAHLHTPMGSQFQTSCHAKAPPCCTFLCSSTANCTLNLRPLAMPRL